MQVHVCGTRGSSPACGIEFVRYGGHSSCIGLAHDGQLPSLVLDGGTGLRVLDRAFGDEPFRGSLLLSHLHWDHMHGLPFFKSGARPGARTDVLLPAAGEDPVALLARSMSPPHFPVTPQELGPGWAYQALPVGAFSAEGFDVLVREIPHKGGLTYGFRVGDDSATIAYLSDHAPFLLGAGPDGNGARHAAALELADGVDLLIHDAQYLASEFPDVAYLGHSAIEYAVALGKEAGARAVLLFHHAPERTDDAIDAIVAQFAGAALPVAAAAEGMVLSLTRHVEVVA
jgi:phosphoribosyl 1,2-cyclic phosphodiesterase